MLNIDSKISIMNWLLPRWLKKEPYLQEFKLEDHKMHFIWLIKKHLIIIKMNLNEIWFTVEQPNGMALTWYKSSNYFGVLTVHK